MARSSPSRLERELQLISVECSFQQACCTSLAASASLLSSVTAFGLIDVIICKNETMSRPGSSPRGLSLARNGIVSNQFETSRLTAYPAITRGAAKDQLRGRREFYTKQAFMFAAKF
jgi:hypothetical protein